MLIIEAKASTSWLAYNKETIVSRDSILKGLSIEVVIGLQGDKLLEEESLNKENEGNELEKFGLREGKKSSDVNFSKEFKSSTLQLLIYN